MDEKIKFCPVCGATDVLNCEIKAAKKLTDADIREFGCRKCKHGGIISIEEDYVDEAN